MRACAEYHGATAVISSPPMRARPRLFRAATSIGLPTLFGALLSTWAANAEAIDCGAPTISTCIDDDNLWPHAGSSHFLSIGGTGTIEAGQVGFGVVASYLSRPIVLNAATPGPGGSFDYVIDNQVNTSFLWSYGIARGLELDLVLPVTFGQSGTGTSPITGAPSQNALSTTAMRDLRFGVMYTLVARPPVDPYAPAVRDGSGSASVEGAGAGGGPSANGLGLAARFEMSAPTGDTQEFATNGSGVWMPGLSADYRYGRFLAAGELGARLRPTQDFEGGRIGNQGYLALGGSVDLFPSELVTLAAEAFFLPTSEKPLASGAQYSSPAEWMISVRTVPIFGGALQIQLAGGGPIALSNESITNPRFRFSLSIRYGREWRDSDGDGVSDADDKCPFVRGIPNNPAGNGCPPSATTERIDLTAVPLESPPASSTSGPASSSVPTTPTSPATSSPPTPSSPSPGDGTSQSK
jgi:OmpA-OmpF porin, OOP family